MEPYLDLRPSHNFNTPATCRCAMGHRAILALPQLSLRLHGRKPSYNSPPQATSLSLEILGGILSTTEWLRALSGVPDEGVSPVELCFGIAFCISTFGTNDGNLLIDLQFLVFKSYTSIYISSYAFRALKLTSGSLGEN